MGNEADQAVTALLQGLEASLGLAADGLHQAAGNLDRLAAGAQPEDAASGKVRDILESMQELVRGVASDARALEGTGPAGGKLATPSDKRLEAIRTAAADASSRHSGPINDALSAVVQVDAGTSPPERAAAALGGASTAAARLSQTLRTALAA